MELLVERIGVVNAVDFEVSARNGPPVADLKVRPLRVPPQFHLEVLEGILPLSNYEPTGFSLGSWIASLFGHAVVKIATIN